MRKALGLLIILGAFAANAVAVDTSAPQAVQMKNTAVKPEKPSDLVESLLQQQSFNISSAKSAADLPGTKVGETAYNYQTNDNLHDRIYYNRADGTIHVQWMYADISEVTLGFPGRRMYYDFYDGNAWVNSASLGVAMESARAGYGSLAVNPDNVAYGASHHTLLNEESISTWYDFMPGFGFFSEARIWSARGNDLNFEPFWPDIAIDELGNIFITSTNNNQDDWVTLVNGVNDNIMYWKSTDNGASWSDWYAMFPDSTTYPLSDGASGPNEAGSHQVAVSKDGSGKVGVLVGNAGHDLYFFESEDRGETFKPAVQVVGNKFFDPADSLTYPMLWDIAIEYDSTTSEPVDTLLSAFTQADGDPVPNIRPRPQGPADLFYLNGEAHVVWNELIWTDGFSYYPNGYGLSYTSDFIKYLDGSDEHEEGGFRIKHWSPSTGVSTIYKRDKTTDVYPGTFQQFVSNPQIGADEDGNLYCVFIRYSETDTLRGDEGIEQSDETFGPLSFGKIWGAKSTDGGATWHDATQLIAEEDAIHQNLRYPAIADYNGNDAIHVFYQNTPEVPGVPIGEGSDHNTWATADMIHWAIPAETFSDVDTPMGPELELVTSSKFGGLNFGDIGDVGTAELTFMVKNVGDEDLVVGPVFTGTKAFEVSPTEFTVAPGGEQEVTVTFKPYVEGYTDSYVAIPNNDATEGSAGIPVEGSGLPTAVADRGVSTPVEFALSQNYPNPFNPSTTISYDLAADSHVELAVYDALGRNVKTLVNKKQSAGSYQVNFDASDLASGIYFYHLQANDFTQTKRMLFLK